MSNLSESELFFESRKESINLRFFDFVFWLTEFKNLCKKNSYIHGEPQLRDNFNLDDIAKQLNTTYWFRFHKTFKEYVKDENGNPTKIKHHKIISATELCIMDMLPFSHTNETTRLEINADFAMFVGNLILFSWNELDTKKVEKAIEDLEIIKFLKDHRTWLINLSVDFEYPVFLNSQVWHLYLLLIKDKMGK